VPQHMWPYRESQLPREPVKLVCGIAVCHGSPQRRPELIHKHHVRIVCPGPAALVLVVGIQTDDVVRVTGMVRG
jgi:hypothetical protein